MFTNNFSIIQKKQITKIKYIYRNNCKLIHLLTFGCLIVLQDIVYFGFVRVIFTYIIQPIIKLL